MPGASRTRRDFEFDSLQDQQLSPEETLVKKEERFQQMETALSIRPSATPVLPYAGARVSVERHRVGSRHQHATSRADRETSHRASGGHLWIER